MEKLKLRNLWVPFILMITVGLFWPGLTKAQGGSMLTGKVTDTSGAALPQVSVLNVTTGKGTFTLEDGRYSIEASQGAVIRFSYVGYTNQEITYTGQPSLDITLKRNESDKLGDVVVIGYGTQRKEAITGSVATIGGDQLREVPASNVSQALQGRMPGVQLVQTSSKPGATMQIRVRGTRSLTASNDPLIVLDGIPFAGTIADISSDDIKSIDILKDASATAIYGSRGANGVVLITTNGGHRGEKAIVSYNGYYGIKDAIKYPMMSGPEYVKLRELAAKNSNGVDENDSTNTDWQDLFYRQGIVTNQDIGISGGTKGGSYKFGAGYYKDQAVIPLSEYNRYSIRGSLDQAIGKYFRFGFTSNNNYNTVDGANMGLYGVLSMSPLASPYDQDGTLRRTVRMPQDEQWVYTRKSIESLGDKYVNQDASFGSYNSLYGEVNIPWIEGLKYRINLGANYRTTNSGSYTGEGVFSSTPDNLSSASIGNATTTNWALENILTYDRTFAQKHHINVVALYSAEKTKYTKNAISRKGIAADAFQYFNLGQSTEDITIDPGQQIYQLSGLTSYMGRIMYSYADKYMLSATFRSDASSRLAKGHQWHSYPAISAGWNIDKEAFMRNVSWLDQLKLRVGYGQTSNQAIAPYATLGLLSTRPYNFGTEGAFGYYVSQLPNSDLGWEYSNTKNIGLDFAMLNHRLSGTLEYYTTDTKDLLLSVGLPATSGVSSYVGNVGATANKGWEISLNGIILDNLNGWTWEAGVNFYGNKNKIVSLASGQTRDESNWWFVGHPLNVIYDYKNIGIWQEGDANLQDYEPGGNVGMIKVLYTGDYNEDGTPTRAIGADDRQILDADPDFQGGFNTRVTYKNFDFTIVGSFQSGGILNSTLYGAAGYLNLEDGRRGQIQIDYWTPENTSARFPLPGGITNSNNPKYGSTLGYFDASYLKIQTMTLGYNFAGKGLKKAGIQKLRAYATVQNPFVLFSPYHKASGMDPETNSYGNDSQNAAVPYDSALSRLLTVGYNTPSTHNYMIGINLTF